MATKLLVLADLGHCKIYQLDDRKNFSTPRLHLLEDWQTNPTRHVSEELSDQAGQYRRGVPAAAERSTAMSDGEQHHMVLERRRRALKVLARRIEELLDSDEVDECYLAADRQINTELLAALDQRARSRIQRNVPANLTHLHASEVIQRFNQ